MIVPYLKVEKQRELKDSIVLERSRFLTQIRQLRPHVITDLYTSSFPEYVFSITEHFKDQLLDNKAASQESAFLRLTKQIIQGIEPRHEPAWLPDMPKSTRDLIALHRPELVIAHLAASLSEPQLVELASIPLMRVFASLMHLEEPKIAEAFPNWATVITLPYCRGLINALSGWSLRWNLDAEWCRDHALRVLRQSLLNDPLRWRLLYGDHDPPRRNSLLAAQWLQATQHYEFAVAWSQAVLSEEVFDGAPEELSIKFGEEQEFHFKALGFNPIIHSAPTWKRQIELDFRIYLYQSELERLNRIKSEQNDIVDLENRFAGALISFKDELGCHIERMTRKLEKAEAKHRLSKVKAKREHEKHISWAVRYQIPKTDSQGYELESEIARTADIKPAGVSKVITATLQQIGLPKRRALSGRKIGSKTSVSAKILRDLGR